MRNEEALIGEYCGRVLGSWGCGRVMGVDCCCLWGVDSWEKNAKIEGCGEEVGGGGGGGGIITSYFG
jgi:hypothetical protein